MAKITVRSTQIAAIADEFVQGERTLFTVNVAHMRMLATDARFRHAYGKANMVVLDSVFFSKAVLRGRATASPGSDIVLHMFGGGILDHRSVAIVGNPSEEEIRPLLPRTELSVFRPSMKVMEDREERRALIAGIAQSEAEIVLLCLGAPKSEILAAEIREWGIDRPSLFCCGASLEFLTGAQSRAPKPVRGLGLEWAWRLVTNPRRMASRYASDALFLLRNVQNLVALRRTGRFDCGGAELQFSEMRVEAKGDHG